MRKGAEHRVVLTSDPGNESEDAVDMEPLQQKHRHQSGSWRKHVSALYCIRGEYTDVKNDSAAEDGVMHRARTAGVNSLKFRERTTERGSCI
jgi:hypothetical protein